jgi:tripartite motif-containing protein 71
MRMRGLGAFAATLGFVLAGAGGAAALTINPGDLIVVDRGNGTLDDINPTTGALNFIIASGFSNPQGLAISSQGMIFVSDIGTSTVDEVNPTTGVVTTFSGGGVGSGPALDRPFQMVFSGGTLYVADGGTPNGNTSAVYAIDAAGNRTTVAGNNGSSNNLFAEGIAGLAIDTMGHIFVSEATGPHTIYTVGPGTATPLTSAVVAPQGLAIGAGGALFAVSGSPSNPLLASIDPTTGVATILSDNNGTGSGPAYGSLRGLVVAPDGTVYATDVGNDAIFRIDPTTGDRTLFSGNGVGGTTFGALTYGIALYPASAVAPEPSSLAMLGLGGLGAWLVARRRVGPRSSSLAPAP